MKKMMLNLSALVLVNCCFANGAYLEFKITGKQDGITGSMKSYTQDGNTRTEMQMNMPQMPGGGINNISLILKDNPDKIYVLNEAAKTYTEHDKSAKSGAEGGYEVTVLGKENVNGYNSTHVKVKQGSSGHEVEMWVSTDLPNYAKYKAMGTKYTDDYLFRSLAVKGVDGFPVRILANEHGHTMQLDLVKAEEKNNPASLFSLDGYSKSSSPSASGSMPNMHDIQNMTPEQRQQMIEQLKQQYGVTGNPK